MNHDTGLVLLMLGVFTALAALDLSHKGRP